MPHDSFREIAFQLSVIPVSDPAFPGELESALPAVMRSTSPSRNRGRGVADPSDDGGFELESEEP